MGFSPQTNVITIYKLKQLTAKLPYNTNLISLLTAKTSIIAIPKDSTPLIITPIHTHIPSRR